MSYNIAIVEDDQLVLDLITDFLVSTGKFEQIHTFTNQEKLLNSLTEILENLQLIVLDFKSGDIHAELVLHQLHQKSVHIPVIILSSHYNQHLMGYMIRSGARAYLPKNIKPNDLISVIEEVIGKGHYISPEQFPHLKTSFLEDTPAGIKHISDINKRDIEIIYQLANQKTAREIADKMCVSPKTIEGYKNALFTKTGTKSVVGLVLFAIQNNLISAEAVNLGGEV